jgi:hypothetical protein
MLASQGRYAPILARPPPPPLLPGGELRGRGEIGKRAGDGRRRLPVQIGSAAISDKRDEGKVRNRSKIITFAQKLFSIRKFAKAF